MTALTYYCSVADVRLLAKTSTTECSDANVTQFIVLAQEDIDKLTHTSFLVSQSSGTATSGTTTAVTNSGVTWTADEWNANADLTEGFAVWIYSGTNSGEIRTIIDGTTTALTVSPAFPVAIDNTSVYRIIKNTYVTETFTGDGTSIYFTDFYPVVCLYSTTIDSTSVTTSYVYKNNKVGKLTLGTDSEVLYWSDTYPELCNVKYYYGVFPLPTLVRELTAVFAAISTINYVLTGNYSTATSYSVPDYSITKGSPLGSFTSTMTGLVSKRDFLMGQLLNSLVRPSFG